MIRCLGLKRKTIALYKYTETLTFRGDDRSKVNTIFVLLYIQKAMAALESYFGLNNNLLSASYFMVLKRIGSSTFTKEAERRKFSRE